MSSTVICTVCGSLTFPCKCVRNDDRLLVKQFFEVGIQKIDETMEKIKKDHPWMEDK